MEATIVYEVEMLHWPRESTLVRLDPPIRRYNQVDGSPIDYEHIVVQCQSTSAGAAENAVYLFPSNERGEFVQEFMTPLEKRTYGHVHSVLVGLGYTVTN